MPERCFYHQNSEVLFSTRRTIIPQEFGKQPVQVLSGTFSLTDTVRAVRISHKLELLIVFDQFIHEHFGILIMHVIIAGTVNIK